MKTSTYFYVIFALTILTGCKQAYTPPSGAVTTNYLVVFGFLNSGADSTIVTLKHTYSLAAASAAEAENNAQVSVENDAGAVTKLSEYGNGRYGLTGLSLDNNRNYRVRIITSGGKTYLSAFTAVKIAPPIDSLEWNKSDTGVSIFVNTHDPQNNTRYYMWDYIETWEFHSFYQSYVHLDSAADTIIVYQDLIPVPHVCWQSDYSSNILIASSAKLSSDIISKQAIAIIPVNSEKIAARYSILVRQYALTKDAFNYWQALQKSTEQTGTLFDQLPSSITGNVQCITNPGETVLGYVSAGSITTKRIFIDSTQVQPWEYYQPCGTKYHVRDSLTYYLHNSQIPIGIVYGKVDTIKLTLRDTIFRNIDGYIFTDSYCADCTVKHGDTLKPSYW
ncbi:MAG TPA: DUF4249 domain-containing protein [Puia sp.]|nr:DUF4249 domain-containing protein [Puia sp.]